MSIETMADMLANRTVGGKLYSKVTDSAGKVRCYACGHRCKISEGKAGVCKMRFNKNGVLHVPNGYVSGMAVDPIEKKPFFHVMPGALALSFGMLGCNFHCDFCQNWHTSQTLRDPDSTAHTNSVSPETLISFAKKHGAPIVTSTYNEPLITTEWAVEIFKVAKAEGLKCSYVSNGHASEEVLDYIRPYVDLYKVDLKSFQEKQYQRLGGQLKVVTSTIEMLVEKGFWVEVVTLVVPGFNDSDEELKQIAQFLANVSVNIPWHVTAFHQNYKMTDNNNTSPQTLLRAAAIGENAGLNFVYAGNLPGQIEDKENTYCPQCQTLLVGRFGFRIFQNRIGTDGQCPDCGTVIPGVWR